MSKCGSVHWAAVACALASLALGARAQSVLQRFAGMNSDDGLGWAVDGAGDVNGDGLADLIVAASWTDEGLGILDRVFFNSGSVQVLSGLDGSPLHAWSGDAFFDVLGWSVAGAGDVNGDGRDDVIVGALYDRSTGVYGWGSAHVFSGLDGSELHAFHTANASDYFGWSVDGAGDVDGDGHADLVVGAPGADRVYVHSGKDGALLRLLDLGGSYDFGYAVAGAGDMDGDGRPELVVGAPQHGMIVENGLVRVYSGADGLLLHAVEFGGQGGGWFLFGAAVADAGDVDADGRADWIAGAPIDPVVSDAGEAWVYSGRTGAVLHRFRAARSSDIDFGPSVDGAGDVDCDGHGDLLVAIGVGTSGQGLTGGVRVYSGADGSALWTLEGAFPGDDLGRSVRAAGDVNGDGRSDLIAGAPGADPSGSASGLAEVIACCDFVGQEYCEQIG